MKGGKKSCGVGGIGRGGIKGLKKGAMPTVKVKKGKKASGVLLG